MVAIRFFGSLKNLAGKVKKIRKNKPKAKQDIDVPVAQSAEPQSQPAAAPIPVATVAMVSSQPKTKKIEKRFGAFLLDVSKDEFEGAAQYFKAHPDEVKIKKGTKVKTAAGKEVVLTHSIIAVKTINGAIETYAMASGEYLGEGAYGRVKIAQKQDGKTFAVKVEGKGKAANEVAEETISKWIGYLAGTTTRKLAAKKTFKGKEVEDKTYTIYQLRKGKEIFEQLYTNVLTPGQLYTKEEQEQLRRKDNESLSETQRLLIAMKSCQAVQDLHNRGVIHGDLKPANLMASIEGHQIVVGAIDYGFSMLLDKSKVPPETVVVRDGAPEGTHPRYMPPEVRVGSKHSDNYQPGQTALFSTASDVYSLGVMFADDMQLPAELTDAMKSDNPKDRASLYQVMDNLVSRLEALPAAERTPEIDKIIQEHRFGVRRMHEANGPAQQPTFVAQLISGFRDPRESTGDASKSTSYTTEEYQEMAIGIFDVMDPKVFYADLSTAFSSIDTKEEQDIFIHNAGLLINEILKADVGNEHKATNIKGIEKLNSIFNAAQNAQFSALINEGLNIQRAEVVASQEVDNADTIDIAKYIDETLQNAALDNDEMMRNVDAFTDDLKERNIENFLEIKPFDFHGKKIEKDKLQKYSYTKISGLFNQLSNRVIHDVTLAKSKEHQQRIYAFYVHVLEKSLEKGDYNTAQAINSAFGSAAFTRLDYLFKDAALQSKTAKASETLNPQRAYKAMREDVQRKNAAGIGVVPLLSSLGGDLTFAKENAPISSVTNKSNGDKVQLLGSFIRSNIVANQQRLAQIPRKSRRTNLVKTVDRTVADINYYHELGKKFYPPKAKENGLGPDFSAVTEKPIDQRINESYQKAATQIASIKDRLNDLYDDWAEESAKVPPDVALLIKYRNELISMGEEVKNLTDALKNNSLVTRAANEIEIDEKVIGDINRAIKSGLVKLIADYNDGKLNDAEAESLYAMANDSSIFSDFYFSDDVLPFKRDYTTKQTLNYLRGEPAKDFRNVLNRYARAIYASQSSEANRDDPDVIGNLKQWKREIEEIIDKVNRGLNSTNEEIKVLATKLNADIQPMIAKYNDLQNQLQKPAAAPVAPKSKKSLKNVAKSLANRVKAIRHTKPKEAVEQPPNTLELINRLHEETLKFNRYDAPPERKVAPVAQPAAAVSAMPNDSNIGIEFEDDEVSPAASADLRTAAPAKAEPAVEQRSILIEDDAPSEVDDDDETLDDRKEAVPVVPVMPQQPPQQPAPNSPHMKAFSDFQRFQTMLAADHLDDRNQIKVDAMKMGVRFMLSLPKENKPKNLSDIVKQAMVANPSSSLDITTKEAAKTILAAIISPNANLNDLTAQAGKIISRIEKLKQTNPMTPQIKKKIALREDVHKYLRTLIEQKTLQMNETVKAQVERAQPIIPTKKNIQSDKRAQAKKTASLEDPAVHLQQCIVAFKKLIESADDTERAKFLKEGSDVSVQLKSVLIELQRLNPQKVTADDVERLYIRGKKYWKEEGNQPLRDNPLIKLRDQLPRQQPGVRHSL